MKNDPGLFTDSTGEGMAGSIDVSLETQQNLKETLYNGSKACKSCGSNLNPVQALSSEHCPNCSRRNASKLLKNRMAP
jgi:predicted RNA-binding Zn-ribbon protein involved in translation (DUF1610 family)